MHIVRGQPTALTVSKTQAAPRSCKNVGNVLQPCGNCKKDDAARARRPARRAGGRSRGMAHAMVPAAESPGQKVLCQLELFLRISIHLGLKELGRLECTAKFFGGVQAAALDTDDPRTLIEEAAQLPVLGTTAMVWSRQQRSRRVIGVGAYAMATLVLLGGYGFIMLEHVPSELLDTLRSIRDQVL